MRATRDTPLGELERAVLDRLWSAGPCGVQAMHAALGSERGSGAKTIHSALERLVRKGLILRRKIGRAYEYRAALSRREWTARRLAGVAGELPGTGPETLVAAFVDLAERAGEAQLAELERAVRARRRHARRSAR